MAKVTVCAILSVFLLLGGFEAALFTYETSISLHKKSITELFQRYTTCDKPNGNSVYRHQPEY